MKRLRLMSLDVFRGLTIVLMIIVNSPGNQSPFSLLAHSEWDGCTFADLVFPFFIVIVGISAVLGLSNLQAKGDSKSYLFTIVLRRSIYIFLMGLLLNAFPHHFDVSTLRILGVLQRISICYAISACLFLTTSAKIQAWIASALLIGYAILMSVSSPVGNPLTLEGNWVGYVDRWVFSSEHLYTPTFDPEGLLSTLPAVATVLLGNLIGYHLISYPSPLKQFTWMVGMGFILCTMGWMWQWMLPFNKALWSSSYVLWTSGIALFIFSLLYFLIEIKCYRKWSRPFVIFGQHAMMAYVLHVLFLKIQAMVHLHNSANQEINLRVYLSDRLFGYLSPATASFCYSLSYMLICLGVIYLFIKIKQRKKLNKEVIWIKE